MKAILLSVLVVFYLNLAAQKPPIDTTVFKNWQSAGGAGISPDGNYIFYYTINQSSNTDTLYIRSTANSWEKHFPNSYVAQITEDSRYIIFEMPENTLCIITLGSEMIEAIPRVRQYKIASFHDITWIAYMLDTKENDLVLSTLTKDQELHFPATNSFTFSENCKYLLVNYSTHKDSVAITKLKLIDLEYQNEKVIWSGVSLNESPGNFVFDRRDGQLAFIVERNYGISFSSSLYYYKEGMIGAESFVDTTSPGIMLKWTAFYDKPKFSDDGTKIFFKVNKVRSPLYMPGKTSVDIWSYRDTILQSLQLNQLKSDEIIDFVVNISERSIIRLVHEDEYLVSHTNDIAIIAHQVFLGNFEAHWNPAARTSFYLVTLKDGFRKLIMEDVLNSYGSLQLSPGGQWIIYFNFESHNYFSYQLATGITRNITKAIRTIWTNFNNEWPEASLAGDITWLSHDDGILIRDNYDLWQVDAMGIDAPLNLTNGYGKKHGIRFEIFNSVPAVNFSIYQNSTVILRSFNTLNKNMGFYKAKIGFAKNPEFCSEGSYVYGGWGGHKQPIYPSIRALNSDSYIVIRMGADNAPNYFFTIDFKKFASLSNIQPQKSYNWLKSELIHWKMPSGSINSGILYKPENFDPSKKYPIIFDIYEIRSDELNLFINPKASEDRINIPWFVSNGYLIFTPDIHYELGKPGRSALNIVISAANLLSKMPFVDSKRMGIQGHSFGGYETNYIVSHTNIFAAACAASGADNLISLYGFTSNYGGYAMYHEERQQGRIGTYLWKNPNLYIENSPIIYANRVSTPLLLVNNKEDDLVPFTQGVEFFTALRRLGKKVWMLQYDGSDHSVSTVSAMDYHIRLTQFFDHYLKMAVAPKWMTRGVPAKLKGIDGGLDLDYEIKTPGRGLK